MVCESRRRACSVEHHSAGFTDARALGVHLLAELHECSRIPTRAPELQRHMEEAARRVGATIVQSVFHEFNPYGLSGVVIIAESHMAVHTWPEHRCVAIDLFTCGRLTPQLGLDYLRAAFGARDVSAVEIPRGTRVSAICE